MRKNFFVLFIAFLVLASCKRNNSKEEDQAAPPGILTRKVLMWFEAQRKANQPYKDKIQELEENLDMQFVKTESYGGRNVMIVPIKKGYKTLNNKDRDPVNYLLLYLDTRQEISGGRVVQYVGGAKTMPGHTILKMLNNEDIDCDGSFTFTNIVDRYLFELKFASGKKTDFVYMKPKDAKAGDAGKLQSVQCTDWYLITTHYNFDGTVEVWEDYIGRTCSGCAPISPGLEGSLCDEFEDGSGGLADECCMLNSNATLQSSSVAQIESANCGPEEIDPATGRLTKICFYTWYYNSSSVLWYTWQYKSIETAELEKFGPVWKFKNMTHVGKSIEGDTPPCMSVNDGISNVTVSFSPDRIQAKVMFDYNISLLISCVPAAPAIQRNSTANMTFTAA